MMAKNFFLGVELLSELGRFCLNEMQCLVCYLYRVNLMRMPRTEHWFRMLP